MQRIYIERLNPFSSNRFTGRCRDAAACESHVWRVAGMRLHADNSQGRPNGIRFHREV
jgi:hypothetical protein